jgi:hypothetical protein
VVPTSITTPADRASAPEGRTVPTGVPALAVSQSIGRLRESWTPAALRQSRQAPSFRGLARPDCKSQLLASDRLGARAFDTRGRAVRTSAMADEAGGRGTTMTSTISEMVAESSSGAVGVAHGGTDTTHTTPTSPTDPSDLAGLVLRPSDVDQAAWDSLVDPSRWHGLGDRPRPSAG